MMSVFSPFLLFYLPDTEGELFILSIEEQFPITQCCCHSVFWHTGSHHIIIFIFNFISLLLLTPRKEEVELSFGCHCANFPNSTLSVYRVVFQLSLEHLFGHLSGPSREPSDMSGIEPDGSSWDHLALSTFGCLFWGPASFLTVPRTIWSEWTSSEQFPLAFSRIPLECVFRMVDICYS
jgi:hypothetical protein